MKKFRMWCLRMRGGPWYKSKVSHCDQHVMVQGSVASLLAGLGLQTSNPSRPHSSRSHVH